MSKTGKKVRNGIVAVLVALATIAGAWAKLVPPSLEPRIVRLETIVNQFETVPADVAYIKGQIDILVGENNE